jgi:hypothetical protein
MPRTRFAFEKIIVVVAACVSSALSGCVGDIGDSERGGSTGSSGTGSSGTTGSGSSTTGGASTGGTSTGGTTTGGTNPPGSPEFACDPSAAAVEAPLRRLSTTQYKNSLASLASWALGDGAVGAQIMGTLGETLRSLPEDRREPVPQDLHGSYRRLDQTLQQEHVDGFFAAGVAMGNALSAHLGALVGPCATDADASNDGTCLDQFIQRFGSRALRRPLDASEVAFYKSVYGANVAPDAQAYADVVGVMLNSPQFLYFTEHGGAAVAGRTGVYELSAFELASRLSYQFWDTMPDDALWKAASDGSLLDPVVYQHEVDRIFADPRTRPALSRFVADWLKVEDLPALEAHAQDAVFRSFAGQDMPRAELRQQMIDDVLDTVDYYVWTRKGSMNDLLTTNASLNKGADLAKIYGLPAWDGVSTPPSFAEGARPGLLTRALFLTSGSANTRPIMKGVFIRRDVLCDEIPPPPPGANAVPPQLSPDMTTRQVVEQLTQKNGTVCASCHLSVINPLGFSTENFDALGRARTEQRLFDANGTPMGSKPIDTHSVPEVAPGDTTPSNGAADLSQLIVKSGKANACLARNYFRFTYGRWENLAADGCALEQMRKRVDAGGSIGDLLKEAALSPAFRRRSFQ